MKKLNWNRHFLKMQVKQHQRLERFIIYLVAMVIQVAQKMVCLVRCMIVWRK